jgi:uridylate kinase
MEETIIISLGGSMIIPDELDKNFIQEFKDFVIEKVKEGKRFAIVTGGGKIARKYQQAAKELNSANDEDMDWIGIASLRLNAELMRVIFKEYACEKVVNNLHEKFNFDKPIVIGAAYEPGHSTDWDAVLAAQNLGAKKIINLSNIDHVYDSDPRVNPNAKKIEKISWAEYRKIIPKDWTSGLSSPFDPTASEEAEKSGIEVVIMNGKPIDNLKNYINGGKFEGTIIS